MGLIYGAVRGCTDPRAASTADAEWAVVLWIKRDADPSSLQARYRGWARQLGGCCHGRNLLDITQVLGMTPPNHASGKFGGETPARGAGEHPRLCPEQTGEAKQPMLPMLPVARRPLHAPPAWQAPSHRPLGPFPVGWCLYRGRVRAVVRAVPARPGVRGRNANP